MRWLIYAFVVRIWHKGLIIWLSWGGGGAWFLSKKIFWFLICKNKINWLKRGTKNNMASKIVKNNILDPYDGNDSILFDISKCRWLVCVCGGGGGARGLRPQTPFSTYILSETRNYVYIIFCANTIISSATRHHSNISLVSTNNIWGI